jgi:two-component system copper resistance phosphate regulon response regulator CusR
VKILLVEDQKKLAGFIHQRLQDAGFGVDLVYDGVTAAEAALSKPYDLILLDILLPGKDGFEIMKEIRTTKPHLPVLMLTAKGKVEDKVRGLELGADDYLTKPFEFAELLARIQALLRRSEKFPQQILRVGDLELNTLTRKATRGSKAVELSGREFKLLEFLMRNKNRILTRRTIAQEIWGYSFDSGTNIVDVYVSYLRKELDGGFDRKLIHTVHGVGYILREE